MRNDIETNEALDEAVRVVRTNEYYDSYIKVVHTDDIISKNDKSLRELIVFIIRFTGFYFRSEILKMNPSIYVPYIGRFRVRRFALMFRMEQMKQTEIYMRENGYDAGLDLMQSDRDNIFKMTKANISKKRWDMAESKDIRGKMVHKAVLEKFKKS